MAHIRLIASLGSSFAAGPGIEPVENVAAGRSTRNYPHLLAESLGADLVDLTVSGATTDTILDTVQVVPGGQFAPQVDGLPADADVVTVTAGGNDLSFAGSMLWAAVSRLDPESPWLGTFGDALVDGIPAPTTGQVARAAKNLSRVVRTARERAPHAEVLLVDYVTVLDDAEHDGEGFPFGAEEAVALRHIQSAVARVFVSAAASTGARLVLASTLSRGHGLGSAEPWVFGFETDLEKAGRSFHPNELGVKAVAEELARILAG